MLLISVALLFWAGCCCMCIIGTILAVVLGSGGSFGAYKLVRAYLPRQAQAALDKRIAGANAVPEEEADDLVHMDAFTAS